MRHQNIIIFSSGKNKRVAHEIARGLDGDVCSAVVWDEFFNKIYGEEYSLTKSYALFPFLVKNILDIKADDAIENGHLSRLLAKEIDLFRNTFAQLLVKGKNGGYYATVTDAQYCANIIFIDEFTFEVLMK